MGSASPAQPPNCAVIGAKTQDVASPLSSAFPAAAVAFEAPWAETSIHEVKAKKTVTTMTDRYVARGTVLRGSRASSP